MNRNYKFGIVAVLVCLLNFSDLHAQDTIHNGPFKEYYIAANASAHLIVDPIGIALHASDSSVLSVAKGKVVKVFTDKEDNSISVLVQSNDSIFVYSNLIYSSIRKGDDIENGQIVGQAMPSLDKKDFELLFLISKGNRILRPDETLHYLKRRNVGGMK